MINQPTKNCVIKEYLNIHRVFAYWVSSKYIIDSVKRHSAIVLLHESVLYGVIIRRCFYKCHALFMWLRFTFAECPAYGLSFELYCGSVLKYLFYQRR